MDRLGKFAPRTIRDAQDRLIADYLPSLNLDRKYDVEVFTDGDTYDQGVFVRVARKGYHGPADSGVQYIGSHSYISYRAASYGRSLASIIASRACIAVDDYDMNPKLFPLKQEGVTEYLHNASIGSMSC